MRLFLPLVLFLSLASSAQAVRPDEMLKDPALEARAREISRELRCLVCQGESIDTSEADLAHDMRLLIRDRLAAGQSNAEIVSYLRSRYGDFVLMQPPFEPRTAALWLTPVAALAGGGGIVFLSYRRRGRHRKPPEKRLAA